MTHWAEQVAHDMVSTRDRRALDELGRRPAWAIEESDEFPPVEPPKALGTARVERDPRAGNVGRAGRLTPLQARRAKGDPRG